MLRETPQSFALFTLSSWKLFLKIGHWQLGEKNRPLSGPWLSPAKHSSLQLFLPPCQHNYITAILINIRRILINDDQKKCQIMIYTQNPCSQLRCSLWVSLGWFLQIYCTWCIFPIKCCKCNLWEAKLMVVRNISLQQLLWKKFLFLPLFMEPACLPATRLLLVCVILGNYSWLPKY